MILGGLCSENTAFLVWIEVFAARFQNSSVGSGPRSFIGCGISGSPFRGSQDQKPCYFQMIQGTEDSWPRSDCENQGELLVTGGISLRWCQRPLLFSPGPGNWIHVYQPEGTVLSNSGSGSGSQIAKKISPLADDYIRLNRYGIFSAPRFLRSRLGRKNFRVFLTLPGHRSIGERPDARPTTREKLPKQGIFWSCPYCPSDSSWIGSRAARKAQAPCAARKETRITKYASLIGDSSGFGKRTGHQARSLMENKLVRIRGPVFLFPGIRPRSLGQFWKLTNHQGIWRF